MDVFIVATPHDIGYRRYSDPAQRSGSSEYRQTADFDEFCARSGRPRWKEDYHDDGASAYHGIHRTKEFGRLLSDCERQLFPAGSVVWFETMSRFGRGKLNIVLGDWQTIIDAGYKIHVGTLGRTFDATTPQIEMMGVIMEAIMAHGASAEKSKWIKAARKRIRETGRTKKEKRPASCPLWISVGIDGEYQFNDKLKLVKKMGRLCLEGHGCKVIWEKLGKPTRKIKRKGKIVEAAIDIRGVLRNRALIGEYQPMTREGKSGRTEVGPVKQGFYPVDPEIRDQFFTWQAALDSRRTMRGRKGKIVTNLFQELIHGSDGESMYIKCEPRGRVLRRRTPAPENEYRTWKYAENAHADCTSSECWACPDPNPYHSLCRAA